MTRNLNITKMKLDAAKAIRVTVSERGGMQYAAMIGVHIGVLDDINKNKIKDYSLQQLYDILARLTP